MPVGLPRTFLLGLAALLGAALVSFAEGLDDHGGQDPGVTPLDGRSDVSQGSREAMPEGDPFGDRLAVRAAIERGLDFLAARQRDEQDGSFPPTQATKHAPVAVTALAALAFMSTGSSQRRGPREKELARAIDFLLAQVDRAPDSKRRGYIFAGRDEVSRTHGHGFATLALAQAHGNSPGSSRGAQIAEALTLAVACIESSQGLEGGWFYDPVAGLEHEGSVTIAMVQALRAAKNVGVRVNPAVIAKAVDYVERSQKEDGSFRYSLGSEITSVALTAAALSTLHATGKYHGSSIVQAYDYIQRKLRSRELPGERGMLDSEGPNFPYYERLYLAQAFWQNPDQGVFRTWAKGERREILKHQGEDGSWGDSPYGDCYATAVNVLVLALPDQLLPIFQR